MGIQLERLKVLSEELDKINELINIKHDLILKELGYQDIRFIILGQLKTKIIKCMIDTSFHILVTDNNITYEKDDFIKRAIDYVKKDNMNDNHFTIAIIQNLIFGTFSIFENSISNIFFHLYNKEEVEEIYYQNIDETLNKINENYNIETDRSDYKKLLNKHIPILVKLKHIGFKLNKSLSSNDKKFIELTSCLRNALSHSNTISTVDIDYVFKGYHYKFKKGDPAELYVTGLGDVIKEFYNIVEKFNPCCEIKDKYQDYV